MNVTIMFHHITQHIVKLKSLDFLEKKNDCSGLTSRCDANILIVEDFGFNNLLFVSYIPK